MATHGYTLRQLLMGKGVWDARDPATDAAQLDRHLHALAALLPKVYGNSGACKQAVLETTRVAEMGCSAAEVAAKRAMLLVGLAYEPSLELYWKRRDAESGALAADLAGRVLPFVTPRFFRHCCQCPEQYVTLALLLADMWKGERLANWPHTTIEPLGS